MRHTETFGTRTRGLAGALAALLAALLLVAVEPAAASHYTNTTELSGTTNTAVAASWSKATFPTSASEVLLGRDDLFADSLASGGMQGSRPLLLTSSQTLSSEADAELNRLKPSVVNIMGGPSAVSTAVEDDLKSEGYTVRRFSGPTRIETAIDIARRALPAATSAIVAAAFEPPNTDPTRAFADSIAAGGWAADRNMPVLLTESQRLSTSTKNYLRGAQIRTVFVVGGSSAINDAVITELQQIGMTVERVSGPTRFDTAVEIAKERGYSDASKASATILTEGQASDAWAAGFTAAAYSAANDAPIVLANGSSVPAPTGTWLAPSGKAAATELTCAPKVNRDACDTASEAMGHTPITGSTPRLLAATLGTTAAGATEVSFTFTEPLAAQVSADKFRLYTFDNLQVPATTAARDTARQDVVVATFPEALADDATVAAVAFEAGRGLTSNVPNAEGSVGLQSVTPASGDSRGPILVSVAEEDDNEVNFTFDKPVAACGPNNKYRLVLQKQATGDTGVEVIRGTSGDAVKVDDLTCQVQLASSWHDDDNMTTDTWSGNVGRGVVDAAAVTAVAGGYANPPGGAHVGATEGPDLTGVARESGSTVQMRFTFDQQIDTAVNVNQAASRFKVYDSRGRVFSGTGAAPDATQGTTITRVLVTFDAGALRNVIVGGFVEDEAVKGSLLESGLFNGADEEPMAPGSTTTGNTAAPRLTGITRSTSGSGSTASVTIRFTYSGTVDRGPGTYHVYTDAGERVQLAGCSVVATAGNDDVDCTVSASSAVAYNAAIGAEVAGATYDAIRPAGQSGFTQADSSPSPEHGGTIS
ncbi:MAG TPA: cell wall-binding repeat-containing protein [Egibacteraceae bacterium]|nr:cell wall-binding repeat-containing protein [Egibacteraceae bacterium]